MRNRKLLIALGAVAFGLLALAGVLLLLFDDDLRAIPNTPRELWQRELESDEEGEVTRITNSFDGYAITVPSSWQIPQLASGTSGLKIYHHPQGQAPEGIDVPEGLFLSVRVEENPNGLSLSQWLAANEEETQSTAATVGSYSAQKVSRPIQEYNDQLELEDIENTLQNSYYISQAGKVFILSCSAQGEEYREWVTLCEEQLSSFTVLQ